MYKTLSVTEIKQIMHAYGFYFKKNFGQNFLIDNHVLNKIIASANIGKEDAVLEVGPGIGCLTGALIQAAGSVTAVEIDNTLIPILKERFGSDENFTLINDDILKVDVARLFPKDNKVKVVANLPYYITTPIVMGLLENCGNIESIIVMVQKEVGQRMQAGPGSKDYGSLSLAVRYYADAEIVANVPQNCFIPKPNVDSIVVKLNVRETRPVNPADEALMFKLIRVAFSQRRKTLLNCIFNSTDFNFNKEEIKVMLEKAGINENIRGEALELKDFAALANVVVLATQ